MPESFISLFRFYLKLYLSSSFLLPVCCFGLDLHLDCCKEVRPVTSVLHHPFKTASYRYQSVPSSFAPTTSIYGIFFICASRILYPIFSARVSISARTTLNCSVHPEPSVHNPYICLKSGSTLTCTGASHVGNAPAKCSIRIPINLSMDPKITRWIMIGRCFSPSAPVYSRLKSERKLEIKLDGSTLPCSSDRIFQMEVDLRSVECSISFI